MRLSTDASMTSADKMMRSWRAARNFRSASSASSNAGWAARRERVCGIGDRDRDVERELGVDCP
jgi:hypothetical protein